MKPRTRIWPVESDERTVHRGSTHPAELGVERLEGFDGDVLIQMEGKQGPKFRQGLSGPDVVLKRGQTRLFYPCFVPDVAETLDSYRMSMVAITQVPDPRGNVRYLLSKMNGDTSVGITVEGGLLKITGPTERLHANPDAPLDIPITISRSPRLTGPLHLELKPPVQMENSASAPSDRRSRRAKRSGAAFHAVRQNPDARPANASRSRHHPGTVGPPQPRRNGTLHADEPRVSRLHQVRTIAGAVRDDG